jgi:hypothetical protein
VVVPYEGSAMSSRCAPGSWPREVSWTSPETELTPARLATAMDAALERPGFPGPVRLDLQGAARSVEILAELAAGVRAARAQGAGRRS